MATGAQGRTELELGPFRAYFLESCSDPLMSFATPCREGDWDRDIHTLTRMFRSRKTKLRLEYFQELYPSLGGALVRAGLRLDNSALAMFSQHPPPTSNPQSPWKLEWLQSNHRARLEEFTAAQSRSFGMDVTEVSTGWLPLLEQGLSRGSISGIAALDGDSVVGGATLLHGQGVAELAGVFTLPHLRRSGLASHLCRPLLDHYFRDGADMIWLSTEPEIRDLYGKLGFREIGTQMNFSEP